MKLSPGSRRVLGFVLCGFVAACGKPPAKSDPFDAGITAPGGGGGGGGGGNSDAGSNGTDGGSEADGGVVTPPEFIVDLRADTNRNGLVELDVDTEDLAEDAWSATAGAVFLANIDDDTKRCPYSSTTTDLNLAACHDAADAVVNGDDDLLDLALLKTVPWPQAPDGAIARLNLPTAVADRVRLFLSEGTTWTEYTPGTDLAAAAIRSGATFAIEAKDIVRDPAAWNGFVDVTLSVSFTGAQGPRTETDVVRLRVAPVLTFHHALATETAFVTNIPNDGESAQFQTEIEAAVTAAGSINGLYRFAEYDQWTQDFFETGYMSMPSASGQHVIRVNYRSANIDSPQSKNYPLRRAGRIVYRLRGKDVAAVQQFDRSSSQSMDTLNSFGNTETIPPYTHGNASYPMGRLLRGKTASFYPDPSFTRMMEAQAVQPPVYVSTEWLLVAHVDETVSFLKVNSPRGWIVLVNDVPLARQMLEAAQANGHGQVKMFVGKYWLGDFGGEFPAEITIDDVLADTDVMNESAISAAEVDAQLNILKAETGITDAEIVRVPFLHQPVDGYSLAYQPGTVNMFVLNDKVVAAPDPHGPNINGVDIFKKQLEDALAPHGYTVKWIEDWNLYHRLAGEVHCGTNAAREIPNAKWWESGR